MGSLRAGIRLHRRAMMTGAATLASFGLVASAASAPAGVAATAGEPRGRLEQRSAVLPSRVRGILGAGSAGRVLTRVIPTARTGPAAALQTLRVGGDAYVIPSSARPYLGRHLDPALFDVTRLADA